MDHFEVLQEIRLKSVFKFTLVSMFLVQKNVPALRLKCFRSCNKKKVRVQLKVSDLPGNCFLNYSFEYMVL